MDAEIAGVARGTHQARRDALVEDELDILVRKV
jgi:hypothetical protein